MPLPIAVASALEATQPGLLAALPKCVCSKGVPLQRCSPPLALPATAGTSLFFSACSCSPCRPDWALAGAFAVVFGVQRLVPTYEAGWYKASPPPRSSAVLRH